MGQPLSQEEKAVLVKRHVEVRTERTQQHRARRLTPKQAVGAKEAEAYWAAQG